MGLDSKIYSAALVVPSRHKTLNAAVIDIDIDIGLDIF